jgi:hypothetical protein
MSIPSGNIIAPGPPAFPANSMYGKPTFQIYRPHFETDNTLKRQKKNVQVQNLSPMNQVGINHNPSNLSLGCRSISDTMYQGTTGPTGISLNSQKLNARPSGSLHTKAMVETRAGRFGANWSQSNQFKSISTWS